jgi:hypothetical protein
MGAQPAVQLAEAAAQEDEGGVPPAPQEGGAVDVVEEDGRRALRDLVQDRDREPVPQEFPRLFSLPRLREIFS